MGRLRELRDVRGTLGAAHRGLSARPQGDWVCLLRGAGLRPHSDSELLRLWGERGSVLASPGSLWLHPSRCQVTHSRGHWSLRWKNRRGPGTEADPRAPPARSPFFRFLCPSFLALLLRSPPSIQLPSFFLLFLPALPSPPSAPLGLPLPVSFSEKEGAKPQLSS